MSLLFLNEADGKAHSATLMLLTGIPSKISLVQNTDRKTHSAIMDASVGAAS